MKTNSIAQLMAIISILLASSCREKAKLTEYKDFKIINLESVEEFNVLRLTDIVDSTSFTYLESGDSSYFGEVDEFHSFDSTFYILDRMKSNHIFSFAENGKYNNRIGSIGKGPGEYESPGAMQIDTTKHEIYVYNNNGQNILVYNKDGSIKSSIKLDYYIRDFALISNDQIALYVNYRTNRQFENLKGYNIIIIDKQGREIKKLFPFKSNDKKNYPGAKKKFFTSSYDGTTLFSPAYSDTIYKVLSGTHEFVPEYVINFGKLKEVEGNPSNGAHIQTFLDLKNHLVLTYSYKGKQNFAFYSKKSKRLKYGNIVLNNTNTMLPFNELPLAKNNVLMGIVPITGVPSIKEMLRNEALTPQSYKEMITSSIKSSNHVPESVKKMYLKTLGTTTFDVNKKNIEFINSLNGDENALVVQLKLKDF